MIILGLDASTTTTAYAVLEWDQSNLSNVPILLHVDHFKPPKEGTIFERLQIIYQFIIDLIIKWQPDHVVLEDIIMFMQYKSQAQTTILLGIWNRSVGLAIINQTKQNPHLLSVLGIRHALKLTKELPSKQEMAEIVSTHLNIKFPWIMVTPTRGKNKNKSIPIIENEDRADAIACALAFLKLSQNWFSKFAYQPSNKKKVKKK